MFNTNIVRAVKNSRYRPDVAPHAPWRLGADTSFGALPIGFSRRAGRDCRCSALTLRSGFTLLELIVTSVLSAMVILAVASVYTSGISIWQATYKAGGDERIYITLERFSREMASALNFNPIGFTCETHRVLFPALVSIQPQAADETSDTTPQLVPLDGTGLPEEADAVKTAVPSLPRPGWINYSFDIEKGELSRSIGIYGASADSAKKQVFLGEVTDVSFTKIDRTAAPASQAETSILPAGVKIEIKSGERTFSRTVYIPTSKPTAGERAR